MDVRPSNLPPHHTGKVVWTGEDITSARGAMIMLHGRGATAESILDVSQYFRFDGVTYIAPQAEGNVWYPYSFLEPKARNEPGLSSAIQRITDIVETVKAAGIPEQNIMLLGFSQGACLSLEWTARQSGSIAAVFGLSGGVIGPFEERNDPTGTLNETFVFLGCSTTDHHVPKEHVENTADLFRGRGAAVTMKLYPDMAHTVNVDEIDEINSFIKNLFIA